MAERANFPKVGVFTLGKFGLDLVSTPLHMDEGSLDTAQNVEMVPLELEDGIRKREGMAKVNAVAAASAVLSFHNIPLPDA